MEVTRVIKLNKSQIEGYRAAEEVDSQIFTEFGYNNMDRFDFCDEIYESGLIPDVDIESDEAVMFWEGVQVFREGFQ